MVSFHVSSAFSFVVASVVSVVVVVVVVIIVSGLIILP